jgi:hypothetical protein
MTPRSLSSSTDDHEVIVPARRNLDSYPLPTPTGPRAGLSVAPVNIHTFNDVESRRHAIQGGLDYLHRCRQSQRASHRHRAQNRAQSLRAPTTPRAPSIAPSQLPVRTVSRDSTPASRPSPNAALSSPLSKPRVALAPAPAPDVAPAARCRHLARYVPEEEEKEP